MGASDQAARRDAEMPPWGADPAHGVVQERSALTHKEIDTIARVGRRRRAEGRRQATCPKAPQFAEGWTIGKPDAVFEMNEDFKIPADGDDPVPVHPRPDEPHRRQVDRGDRDQARQARAHVHHVIAFTQPAGDADQRSGALGPTQHRRRDAEQAGRGVRSGRRRGCSAATPTSSCRCTTRPTARRRPIETVVGVIFAKEPPAKVQRGGSGHAARAS